MVPTVISFIDKLLPGHKTYCLMFLGLCMMICQMMGYHNFSHEAWGLLGIGGATTWKIGMDRDKK